MKASQLPGLNILRVFAALYMVMFHLKPSFLPDLATAFFSRGTSDTGLFFLLSGFLLAHLYGRTPMDDQHQRRFVWKRVARIFPANAAALLLLLLLQWTLNRPVHDWNGFLECLLLLQSWVVGDEHLLNAPAWSMSCLMFFYLIFPVVLPRLERLRTSTLQVVLLALWILGAVVLPELGRWPGAFDAVDWTLHLHNSPLLRVPEFILGMGVAVLVAKRGRLPSPWFRWSVPVVLAVMTLLPGETLAVNNGLFAPLSICLLMGFVNPAPWVERLGASRFMQTVASASICIFLLHTTWTQVFTAWVFPRWHLEWNMYTLALYLGVVVGSSVMLDRWVCLPLSRLLTRRPDRSGTVRPLPERAFPLSGGQPA
ncbi:acyltransferase [Deinococcus radiomollis]|uniref:acyltransferase family protein n=1 Tax=Deinococcus radiomollis TaxID=468916 RepID=UPI00389229A1